MNRRNLFKLLAGATLAAAIEVTGLAPLRKTRMEKWVGVAPEWLTAPYEKILLMGGSNMAYEVTIKTGTFPKCIEGSLVDLHAKQKEWAASIGFSGYMPFETRTRFDENMQPVPTYREFEEEVPV